MNTKDILESFLRFISDPNKSQLDISTKIKSIKNQCLNNVINCNKNMSEFNKKIKKDNIAYLKIDEINKKIYEYKNEQNTLYVVLKVLGNFISIFIGLCLLKFNLIIALEIDIVLSVLYQKYIKKVKDLNISSYSNHLITDSKVNIQFIGDLNKCLELYKAEIDLYNIEYDKNVKKRDDYIKLANIFSKIESTFKSNKLNKLYMCEIISREKENDKKEEKNRIMQKVNKL